MNDFDHCCIQCLQAKSTAVCPHCGDDSSQYPQHPLYLAAESSLHQGQYRIGRVLGQGGFGITYMGLDTHLGKQVAIKEYLPSILATRDNDRARIVPLRAQENAFAKGLKLYIEEARNLARFSHPNIVPVLNFFEQNNTGYMVMEYLSGINVAELLRRHQAPLSLPQALSIMLPVLTALSQLHQKKLYHLDISAQNIFIHHFNAKDEGLIFDAEQIILIDFGAAKCIADQQSNLSVTLILKPGYSPLEQYSGLGNIGAWTDIYACAALLYLLLSRKLPPSATDRLVNDRLQALTEIQSLDISAEHNAVIMTGLALQTSDRFQTIASFQLALNTGQIQLKPKKKIKPRIRNGLILLLFSSIAAFGVAYIYLLDLQQQNDVNIQLMFLNPQRPEPIVTADQQSNISLIQLQSLIAPTPVAELVNPNNIIQPQSQIDYWLAQARKQSKALHFTTPAGDNAYETYQRILKLQADNSEAQQGLNAIAEWYLSQAQQSKDAEKQQAFIDKGLSVQAQHPELLALKNQANAKPQPAELPKAETPRVKIETKFAQQLQQAEKLLQQAQYVPAYQIYQYILTNEANHPQAQQGQKTILQHYIRQAQTAYDNGQYQHSLNSIQQGLQLKHDQTDLLQLQQKIKHAQTPKPKTPAPPTEPETQPPTDTPLFTPSF